MNAEQLHKPLSPHDHAALVDAAKQQAVALRREAISAFWLAVGHGVRATWHAIWRDLPTAPTNPSLEARPCQR
jgi:hypothetical protein